MADRSYLKATDTAMAEVVWEGVPFQVEVSFILDAQGTLLPDSILVDSIFYEGGRHNLSHILSDEAAAGIDDCAATWVRHHYGRAG